MEKIGEKSKQIKKLIGKLQQTRPDEVKAFLNFPTEVEKEETLEEFSNE